MYGRVLWLGGWSIIQELSKGRRKISELRQAVPLYGAAFDLVVSYLLLSGIVRKYTEGGEEYLELTDLGKSLASTPPWGWWPGPWWGWGPGPRRPWRWW